MDTPIVENGLCIRPFEDGDVEQFVSAVRESIATVGAWMPWCRPEYAAADALAWFAQCSANLSAAHAYDLGVFSAAGAEFYGGVSINQINRQHNFGNIGYWVRQSFQRKGIATRAVRAMAAYGFNCLKLTRLEIVAAVENGASRGVAERAGAIFECVARNRLLVNGYPMAAAVYSIVPELYGF
jgi:ribosomal-protein-serine acetyltransferase